MTSRFFSSTGASLLVAMLAYPIPNQVTWRASSDAGSGLPWWTPIAVTGVLFLASAVYRFRHRPKPSGNITQEFQIGETISRKAPQDIDPTSFLRLLKE